ncbi:MAG: aminomethyl-transferring glycine dehydrogenase subunit GcvPA [Thaumarchaeota archaeon]|nr:aminomethyl-transferring glycine dehydrogenase subunit GcvPA [Nitrososphaerota archaeon]
MGKEKTVFPYIPNSVPEVKAVMLKEVGARDEMDLYAEVPERLRFKGKLRLPEPILDEYSLRRHVEGLLGRNNNCNDYLNFLGAGCAQHLVPAVCDEINGRGEFLTAYVGESYADHGKWQALFEYCSLMGELLDMDILSCPLYDGGQAAATSVRMASRLTGRSEVVVPRQMNPEIKLVMRNYLKPDISIKEVAFDPATGMIDLEDVKKKVSSKTAAIIVENPSYLGVLESEAEEIGKIARDRGAEFIVYTDPISLGVVAPPSQYGATIACGDFHPLGIPMVAGGGQGGFIATHDDMDYISEFKDLMFGITETTERGEYGFGEVLYDRTSYGSREKGKEFTGTSTGIWAITAAVYLSLMGPKGMEETGRTIMQMSQYASKELERIEGVSLKFPSPFFKEFVLSFDGTGKTVKKINRGLLKHRVIGGKDISREFPELGQSSLYCVTETKTMADIQRLVGAIKEVV